jgi:signal transduction histidine kinase
MLFILIIENEQYKFGYRQSQKIVYMKMNVVFLTQTENTTVFGCGLYPFSKQTVLVAPSRVGACTNITDRKQTELEIRQLHEQLEERVQQCTAELIVANKELEGFSYSVSDDLRAPLRNIDGFSQTLLEHYQDQLDERGKHYLTRTRAETQRMGELIDNLLQLSRVTRTPMRYDQVNI